MRVAKNVDWLRRKKEKKEKKGKTEKRLKKRAVIFV